MRKREMENILCFFLDLMREHQMRKREMENICEKIAEEGGQFLMLILDSITWTHSLLKALSVRYSVSFTNMVRCVEKTVTYKLQFLKRTEL